MRLPWDLEASTYEAVVLASDSKAGQPPASADAVHAGLHDHFADRAQELHTLLRAVRAEFEALTEERLVGAEEFHHLGEAAHEQAEEADRLLVLLVCCNAPEALVQEVEGMFDALRDLEEQITEALEWDKGLGRRLAVLGSRPNGQPSGR